MQSERIGLLLVGHGTRNPDGLCEFRTLADQVALQGTEFIVEPCFLEIAQPDIAAGIRGLLRRGIDRLIVAPVLLFAAGHAKRDIPAAVKAGLPVEQFIVDQLPALECHERILELSARRFREALTDRPPIDPENTLLILVGRGSSVPKAIENMQQFAKLRATRTLVGQTKACFVAIAKPSLAETLRWAMDTDFQRIVVQPHLLFVGDVLAEISDAFDRASMQQPQRQWILTPHLGPSPLVADAILDLAREAIGKSEKTAP